MQVKILPVNGCLQVFLAIITLGVAPLMIWLNERNWPKAVNDQGLITRSDALIPWCDFSKATRVVTRVSSGGGYIEHFELRHPGGKVVVAPYRLENGQAVLNFIWQRLPPSIK